MIYSIFIARLFLAAAFRVALSVAVSFVFFAGSFWQELNQNENPGVF